MILIALLAAAGYRIYAASLEIINREITDNEFNDLYRAFKSARPSGL